MSETQEQETSPFYGGIKSYDIHTYWNNNNKEETEFAFNLREQVLKDFAKEIENGDIRIYKFWEKPIGPHPINMWELDFKSPEIFSVIVPYFQIHHGKLSVLIHPRSTQGAFRDHTANALWLGHKLRLDTELLKKEA
ncbi:DOPA-like domain-containing protein [Scheffersomyces amazonensis]|uniref:DOPA-like domain-containing protein n=1 Tax=Scheffersomyces amazonensis TaxID=1078765 RepID=UPI00315D72D9